MPADPTRPRWGEVGIHGISRFREWDTVATVEASLPGDTIDFVVLPDGSRMVEDGDAGTDLGPLVGGVDLEPPFRAEAVKREERLWAIAASSIDVVEVTNDPGGDAIVIVRKGDGRETRIDGFATAAAVPELEQHAAGRFDAYVLSAARLSGRFWEVQVSPL